MAGLNGVFRSAFRGVGRTLSGRKVGGIPPRNVGAPPIPPPARTGVTTPARPYTPYQQQQQAAQAANNAYQSRSAVRPPTPSQARAIGQLERNLGQPSAVRPPINQSAIAPRPQVGGRQALENAFNSPAARRPFGVPGNRHVGAKIGGMRNPSAQAQQIRRNVQANIPTVVQGLAVISGVSDLVGGVQNVVDSTKKLIDMINSPRSIGEVALPDQIVLAPNGGVNGGNYTLRFYDPSYFAEGVFLEFTLFGPVSNYRIVREGGGYNVYATARTEALGELRDINLTQNFIVANPNPQGTYFQLFKNFAEPDQPIYAPNPNASPTTTPTNSPKNRPVPTINPNPVFAPGVAPSNIPSPFPIPWPVAIPEWVRQINPFGENFPFRQVKPSDQPGGTVGRATSPGTGTGTSQSYSPETSTSTLRGRINEYGGGTSTCNPCPDPCPEPEDYSERFDQLEEQIKELGEKLDDVLEILNEQKEAQTISSQLAWKNPETLLEEIIQFEGEGLQGIHQQLNAVQELLKQLAHADSRAWRTYRILDGDNWYFDDPESLLPYRKYKPENSLFFLRASRLLRQENPDSPLSQGYEVNSGSLPAFLLDHLQVLYDRLGLHRFPAQVPDSLTSDEIDPQTGQSKLADLADQASFHEWQFRQLDAVLGEFPIQIQYKDANGTDQTVDLPNLAESLAEIVGLVLNVAADAEIGTQLGFSATTEAIRANMSATNAADFARAIADYLGFRYKESSRDVKLSITPGANNIRDSLRPGTLKGQRIEYTEKTDFQEDLRRLVIGTEIIKAAFYRPFRGNDEEFPGEGIRKDRIPDASDVETDNDRKWREFLEQLENPQGNWSRDPGAPKPDLRNIKPRDRKDDEYPPNAP